MNPVVKVITMFGSTIINEPLNIINRQLEHYNSRKNMKLEQELRHEDARFNQQMEFERAKMNAELDDMIAAKEIDRRAKIIQIVAEYQKTMAECAVSINNSLGMMSIELRDKAHNLVLEKKQAYLDMQEDAERRAMAKFDEIAKRFPEGSKARETMEEVVGKQLMIIVESSENFIKTIDDDFKNMLQGIQDITSKAIDTANQYALPELTRSLTGRTENRLMK